MEKDTNIHMWTLISALAIPLIIGGISAALTARNMALYSEMNKPPLSPPAWLFSVAWTLLYLMMGLASYFVLVAEKDRTMNMIAMAVYAAQLMFNFFWSIIFFNMGYYLVAFIWLVMLLCLVIVCMMQFYMINKVAGWLMIPYVLWLCFAAYLNLGSYIVNR